MGKKQKIILAVVVALVILGMIIFETVKINKKTVVTQNTVQTVSNPDNDLKIIPDTNINNSVPIIPGAGTQQLEKCLTNNFKETPLFGSNASDTLYEVASIMVSRDESGCNTLKEDASKKMCLSYFYRFLTLKDKTDAYLGKVDPSNVSNVIGKAYLQKDISLCDGISGDEVTKRTCQVAASMDKKYCDFTNEKNNTTSCTIIGRNPGEEKTGCVMDNTTAKKSCLNSYILMQAFQNKDANLCSQINDEGGVAGAQLFCEVLLSTDPKGTINNLFHQNACYEKFATAAAEDKKDPSICEKMPLKDGQNKGSYDDCIARSK